MLPVTAHKAEERVVLELTGQVADDIAHVAAGPVSAVQRGAEHHVHFFLGRLATACDTAGVQVIMQYRCKVIVMH